jgi:hypothetical protein
LASVARVDKRTVALVIGAGLLIAARLVTAWNRLTRPRRNRF